MTPLFIELSDGSLVNANHVLHVVSNGPNACHIETIATRKSASGQWEAGGRGSMSSYHDVVVYATNYSVQEWASRVNNAIALAQAVERMAT
jgi:hypothetical protein